MFEYIASRHHHSHSRTVAQVLIPVCLASVALAACALEDETPLASQNQELSGPILITSTMVETIGRSVHHLPLSIYSASAGRTFIAYPGCSNSSGICKVNPFLVVYDPSYGLSTPIDLGKLVGGYPGDEDSHNYPSVVIDDTDRLHVFFSRHAKPMQHYRSKNPVTSDTLLDASGWEERPFNASSVNDDAATYVMSFKDSAGDIYVFYRQTASTPGAECVSGWYEPIMYKKSSNSGVSWSSPKTVLAPNGGGGWGTVYMKGVHHEQQSGRDRLHMAFAVTQHHTCAADKVYYGYFDFTNDQMYAPTGQSLGSAATASEWTNSANKMEIHSDPVNQSNSYFSQTVIGVDGNGKPTVFITNGHNAQNKRSIDKRTFGTSWSAPTRLFWYASNNTDPLEVDFQSPNSFTLYVRKDGLSGDTIKIDKHTYLNGSWSSPVTIDSESNAGDMRFSNFAFVKNQPNNPAFFDATYILGEYTHWTTPQIGGMLYGAD